jgi:hypothetical protein
MIVMERLISSLQMAGFSFSRGWEKKADLLSMRIHPGSYGKLHQREARPDRREAKAFFHGG